MLLSIRCGQKDNMYQIQLLEVYLELFRHLIGWAAVDPNLDVMAWMLFLIMFAWQPPHFYALAMRRVEEYRAAGIPMLPVVKGLKQQKDIYYLWITCLIPFPFFMTELGIPFIVLATIIKYRLDYYRDICK